MRPLEITGAVPSRQHAFREDDWRPNDADYLRVGLTDAVMESDDWPPGAEAKVARAAKNQTPKRKPVAVTRDDGGGNNDGNG